MTGWPLRLPEGVNGFGTGAGYISDILTCEACMKKPTGVISCLMMIHP